MKDDSADPPGDLSAEPDDDAPDELPWFTEDELPLPPPPETRRPLRPREPTLFDNLEDDD